jgi:Fe-S-cluster containining protein
MNNEIEKLKEKILKDYPRMQLDSHFNFKCHPGVSCFNECCGDVNIFLTPYDIIRLKNNLGITSNEFLKKYTLSPFDENLSYPVILLKMDDNDKKTCPFVRESGCSVYPDRPWACRMYPLGLASPKEGGSEELDKEFYFLLKESVCKGFEEKKDRTVREWIESEGIEKYNRMGEEFKEITLHKFFTDKGNLTPPKIEMFFMACYDVDKFRSFLFGSSFFNKFEVDEATQANIKEDDVELLKFGYRWLRFALFGEKTMAVKGEVLEAKKEQLAKEKEKKS